MGKTSILLFICLTSIQSIAQNIELINSGEIIDKGIQHYNEGKYDLAIQEYLRVHENDTNYHFMLYELAMTYLANKEYDKAISTCETGLKEKSDFKKGLLKLLGNAYDDSGNAEKAIDIYTKTIKKYPYDYSLYYNLGITYYRIKEYSKAENCFQEALLCNPFHASSHLSLGKIEALQGHYSHAFLSLGTFLAVEPNSERSNEVLVFLNNLAENYIDTTFGEIIEPYTKNDDFERLDYLIKSKIVISNRFNPIIEFSAAIVKQMQLLFEKLPYNLESEDFWIQFYLPFFKAIKDNNYIEEYLYSILMSTNKEEVLNWREKNKKSLNDYYATGGYLTKNKEFKWIEKNGKKEKYACTYYDSGELYAIGNFDDNDKMNGYWQYLYSNGELHAEGKYIGGIKDSTWKYYDEKGNLYIVENYNMGILNGIYEEYYSGTGKKYISYQLIDGKPNGEVFYYYQCGAEKQIVSYIDGKKEGKETHYFPNGVIKLVAYNKDDLPEGKFEEYHENEQIHISVNYEKGLRTGEYNEYYVNGSKSVTGNYIDGKENGIWEYYYSNGNLQYTYNYTNGMQTGKWIGYWKNAQIASTGEFNENGNRTGECKYYNFNGKLHYTETLKNEKIIKAVYYNPLGIPFDSSIIKNNTLDYIGYYANEKMNLKGKFIDNKREGRWEYYYSNGKLKKIENYIESKLNGEYQTFYQQGQIKQSYSYINNIIDGYYIEYHSNGNIKQEGWYVNDLPEGWWKQYYEDGSISQKSYFSKGKLNGNIYLYAVDGKIFGLQKYIDDLFIYEELYDDTGAILSVYNFEQQDTTYLTKNIDGSTIGKRSIICGEIYNYQTWYYPNNTILSKYYYLNSKLFGEYNSYYTTGIPRFSGYYINDVKHGSFEWYHKNGIISNKEHYFSDMKDGNFSEYYDNGQLRYKAKFFNDKIIDTTEFYDLFGELMISKIYTNDEIIGYRYIQENGAFSDIHKLENGTGHVLSYYKNGNIGLDQHYLNGLKNDTSVSYYSNGSLYLTYINKHGELYGASLEYFPNGQLKTKNNYYHSLKHGIEEIYRENGTPEVYGEYYLGKKHGKFKYYNEEGKLEKTEIYWNDLFKGYE